MRVFKFFILCFLGVLMGCNEEDSPFGPDSGVPGKKLKLWVNAYEDGGDLLFKYNSEKLLESVYRIDESSTLLFEYEYVNNRLSKWVFYNKTGESHGFVEYTYPEENTVVAVDYRPTANDEFFMTRFLFENSLMKEILYTSVSWPEDYTQRQIFEHDPEGNLVEVKVFSGSNLSEIFNFTYSNNNSMFHKVTPQLALFSWGPEPFFSFNKQYESVRKRTYTNGNLENDQTMEYLFDFDKEGYPITLKNEGGTVLQQYEYY